MYMNALLESIYQSILEFLIMRVLHCTCELKRRGHIHPVPHIYMDQPLHITWANCMATHIYACHVYIGWTSTLTDNPEKNMILSKLYIHNEVPVVQYNIIIHNDLSWKLFVYGHGTEIPESLKIMHMCINKLISMI